MVEKSPAEAAPERKWKCGVCKTIWQESQTIFDGERRTCGDVFCGANVYLVKEQDSKQPPSLGAFFTFVNGLGHDSLVSNVDMIDVQNGADHIPGEVTEARRTGLIVQFVQDRPKAEWYWLMPGGNKIVHG